MAEFASWVNFNEEIFKAYTSCIPSPTGYRVYYSNTVKLMSAGMM